MGKKFGFSYSWKRALGISSAKSRISRKTGIPLTRSGRRRKAGRLMGCTLPILIALLTISLSMFIVSAKTSPTENHLPNATATPRIYSTETINPQGTIVVQCLIKGNISSNKKSKIYHLPGQRDYEKTIIDTSKGELWFCTEEEALAAGWRKAQR